MTKAMDDNPLISVITPVYNAQATIIETVQSIKNQTYQDFEIICVDDGSTDQSVALVSDKFPDVHIVRKENGGQPTARNAGLRAARGRLITFLDSDDLWIAEKLEKQITFLNDNPHLEWIYSDTWFFEERTSNIRYLASDRHPLLEGDILEPLFLNNFIPSPTLMFRRSVFEQVGVWDETVQTAEDWNMWLRIARSFPNGVCREPLALYRIHTQNKLSKVDPFVYSRTINQIIESHAAKSPERLSRLVDRSKAIQETKVALRQLKKHRPDVARRLLWRAFKRAPFRLTTFLLLIGSCLPRRVLEMCYGAYQFLSYRLAADTGRAKL